MKKLLFMAIMLLMGVTAKATVTLVSADMTNYRWTVSDTQGNLQYVLEAREGDPSNGFKLTLSQLDPQSGTPYVSNDMCNSQYYWETYYYALTEQQFGQGQGHNLSDDLKELVVDNVTLQSNLFQYYSELKKLTLTYDYDVTIPNYCFAQCEDLWKEGIYVNFTGTNFTLGSDAFYRNNQFNLYTNSTAVRDAFEYAKYVFNYNYTGPRIAVTADRTNMVWIGVSETDGVQYELGAINGNPSNGFYLILTPYNNSQGYISTEFVGDGNFWEPYFAAESYAVAGTAYQAANCIKQLTFNNVAVDDQVSNLFANYVELDSVNFYFDDSWNALWLAPGCFSGCTSLDKMAINFTGSSFYTNSNCLNATANYTIYTNSGVVESALNSYKNDNSAAYTVVCTASAVVIDDSQASNMIWSGSDVDSNVQFEIGAIGGNPSNGFYLTLSQLDATKPATVTNALRNDPNFWDSYFYMTATAALGQPTYAKDNIKRLTVNNVTLAQDLFWEYNEMKEVTLNYNYDVTIPQGCFSVCERIDTVFVNFSGSNLGIDDWAFNTNREYVVKTADYAAKRALQNYKNYNGAQFTILYTGEVPQSNYYLIINGLTSEEQAQWRFAVDEEKGNSYILDLDANNLTLPANATFYVGTRDGTTQYGASYENYTPGKWDWAELVSPGYPFLSPQFSVGKFVFHDDGWKALEIQPKRCAKPTVTYSNGKLHFACNTPGVTYNYNINFGNNGETTDTEVTLGSYTLYVSVSAYMQDGSLEWSDPAEAQFDITPTGGQGSGVNGDLNGDGVLSVADITTLANMVVGKGNSQQGGNQGGE